MKPAPLQEALRSLVLFLDREKVPYMVIGAIAGLVWGVRRATFDVDVTLWAPDREEELALRLAGAFKSRVPDPAGFLRETGVLPLEIGGTNVDAVFGRLSYEETAIGRAKLVALGGIEARVCSPEDLIVHKVLSDRPKDIEDVKEISRACRGSLDRGYLDPIVERLSRELSKPSILELYLSCFRAD